MILFKKAADLHKWVDSQHKNGKIIGFVPTMGALHKGHISLLEMSKKQNQVTVCSIFINPAQFNDPKDFEKYPVTIENDIAMLDEAGCDILFLPGVKEIYPEAGPDDFSIKNLKQGKQYALGYLENVLEGKFRPGHFQGVCMVVHQLLEIIQPDNLYLGQKDYQQGMVIKKLIELINWENKLKITMVPTLREEDGLAMSSRNMRLNDKERKTATSIYHTLKMIKDNFEYEHISALKLKATDLLTAAGFRIDYIEIVDATSLSIVNDQEKIGSYGKKKIVALVAAVLNDVRLIDNLPLN